MHNGISYVAFSAQNNIDPNGVTDSNLWIAEVTANPGGVCRAVNYRDPDNPAVRRTDPEIFMTSNGPVLFFNQINGFRIDLRRAQTGL